MTKQEARTIEVEDITVEGAIKKALKMLRAKKSDVSIKVLREEHKGLFGMKGADAAKISATLKRPH